MMKLKGESGKIKNRKKYKKTGLEIGRFKY